MKETISDLFFFFLGVCPRVEKAVSVFFPLFKLFSIRPKSFCASSEDFIVIRFVEIIYRKRKFQFKWVLRVII
jgi:hypothetical protein